jgi:hypothetical protein
MAVRDLIRRDFQLPLSGSREPRELLNAAQQRDFQLPLSGSLDVSGIPYVHVQISAFNSLSRDHLIETGPRTTGPCPLSTPSLGITRRPCHHSEAEEGAAFNSLSRDHGGVRFYRAHLFYPKAFFQLPLSGSLRV